MNRSHASTHDLSGPVRHRSRAPANLTGVTALRTAILPVLLVTCAWLLLALGGAPRWAAAVGAMLAAVALATTLKSRRRIRRNPLLLLLAACTVATALQLLPLPTSVLSWLAPDATALRLQTLNLVDGGTHWLPMSSDWIATVEATVQWALLWALASVALRVARDSRERERLLLWVAGLLAAVAGLALMHKILGLRALYGFYQPRAASPPILGPLLNPNHLACVAAMGVCLSLGLAFHKRLAPRWRVALVAMALLELTVVLLTYSRGALLALAVGSVVLVAGLFASHRDAAEARHIRWPMVASGLGGVVLVALLAGGEVGRQLRDDTVVEVAARRDKSALWGPALDMVAASPWVGVGRGAFEGNFTRFAPASSHAAFARLENEYLQLFIDYGVPLGLGIVVLMVWCGCVALSRWRAGPVSVAALAALAVPVVQSVVDFAVALPGAAAVTVLLLATLCHPVFDDRPVRPRLRGVQALALLVAGAGMLLLPSRFGDRPAINEADVHWAKANQAHLRHHPMDAVALGNAAWAELVEPRRSLALISQALRLAPHHPELHRIAGHALLAAGHASQAALEFRIAATSARDPRRVVTEAARIFADDRLLQRALPESPQHLERIVSVLQSAGRSAVAARWLEELGRLGHVRALDTLIAMGDAPADVVTRALEARVAGAPLVRHRVLLARRRLSAGDVSGAQAALGDRASWRAEPGAALGNLVWCETLSASAIAAGGNGTAEASACFRALLTVPEVADEARRALGRMR